ncbi:MAG: DNA-protecting protein DprA [Bacteroidales bacterium]|nr:MAG: DNA-protecting protein DprA [Bacteroidales bacterium]
MIPKIGSINAKKLIAYCGGIEAVFKQSKKALLKIPGIGDCLASEITNQKVIGLAEKEIEFINKYGIKALFYLDPEYPERLRQCEDCPIVLFVKGKAEINFNREKFISIVGTRKATDYGKVVCEKLIAGLSEKGYNPIIVSGLAYGIDIIAHKSALKNQLQTLAVLGHGLDMIYPTAHRNIAKSIVETGALLTDFPSNTTIDRNNFIKRNRIIAGLSDATIVIESGEQGGALITADLANSYSREVFAVPGNVGAKYSQGCNQLIKSNKAALIETPEDIEFFLGWEPASTQKQPKQITLFAELTVEEQIIVDYLKTVEQESIDLISIKTQIPVSKVSSLLLNLEFAGLVKTKPGKVFSLNG